MRILLCGGRIIQPTGILENHDLVVTGDRITALGLAGSFSEDFDQVIDCSGADILPGIIDLHADYIEHMAAPRPTSLMDFDLSIREAERELITHGITTMYHSLSFYGSNDFGSNPIRSAENSRKLIEVIQKTPYREHIIRHRFHARFEIDNIDRVQELENLIRDGKVHLVSFMDHSPGQGQYRDLELYKLILKGYRKLEEGEADQVIKHSQSRLKLTVETLSELAALARSHGIAVASHDDDSFEKLDTVQGFGATISEFPITLGVAREAKRRGMLTVLGAPNVLLGGSHSGNVSATEAILDGSVDILCSDYYPASMLHCLYKLHREKGLHLEDLINLVSLNPARAVGLENELGSVEYGKLADLLVVRSLESGYPVVTQALVGGELVLNVNYRRSR